MQNKNEEIKNDAIEQGINNREYGTQYDTDKTVDVDKKGKGKSGNGGNFDGDPSEMRKAPGYYDAVPGVNTPEIKFPGVHDGTDVSIPAFNPPVPNRAWTEMRKKLTIEAMSEKEKRELYGNKGEIF